MGLWDTGKNLFDRFWSGVTQNNAKKDEPKPVAYSAPRQTSQVYGPPAPVRQPAPAYVAPKTTAPAKPAAVASVPKPSSVLPSKGEVYGPPAPKKPSALVQDVKAGAGLVGKIVGGIGEAGASAMDRILGIQRNPSNPNQFTVKRMNPVESAKAVGGVGLDALKFGKDLASGILRSGTSLALEVPELYAPKKTGNYSVTPKSPVGKFLLGDQPIKSLSGIASSPETQSEATALGFSPFTSKYLAPVGAVALTATDPFFGGEGGAAKKIAKEAAEKTAKEAAELSARRLAEQAGEDILSRDARAAAEKETRRLAEAEAGRAVRPRQAELFGPPSPVRAEARAAEQAVEAPAAKAVRQFDEGGAERAVRDVAEAERPVAKTAREFEENLPERRVLREAEQAVEEAPKLPRELAGAKPRYGFGAKQFLLNFKNDIDRAAYIAAQKTRSARDADYLKFVQESTGMSEQEARTYGARVRDEIKSLAKGADDAEPLDIPSIYQKPAETAVQAFEKPIAAQPKLGTARTKAGKLAPSTADEVVTAVVGSPDAKPGNVVDDLAKAEVPGATKPNAAPGAAEPGLPAPGSPDGQGYVNLLLQQLQSVKSPAARARLAEAADRIRMGDPAALAAARGLETGSDVRDVVDTILSTPQAEELGKTFAGGGKERGFVTNVKESEASLERLKRGVSGTYDEIPNNQSLAEARGVIESDPQGALSRALAVTDNADDARVSNVIGMELMRKAQNAGDFDTAIALANAAAERGTKLGQAVQVYSMWSRMTPEGALRYASKLLDEAGRKAKTALKLNPEQARRITEQGKRVESIGRLVDEADGLAAAGKADDAFKKYAEVSRVGSKSDASKILMGADKFGKDAVSLKQVADAAKRQQVFDAAILARESASVVPSTIGRKLATYQTMSLLLNAKTTLRNLLGNFGLAAAEAVSDVAGSALDTGLSLVTGRRTKSLPRLGAQAGGFRRGMREGFAEALAGINTNGAATAYDIGKQTGFTFKNPLLRGAEKTMGALLRAPDRAFYQQAYDGTIAELMHLTGSKAVTPDMHEVAHAVGLYRTFQDESKLAQALVMMKNGMNKLGTGDFGLGDAIIKFPKTPANVLNRGLAYSPAGFLRSVWELAKPALGKGPFDQRAFVEATSRALVGTTGLVGTGALLASLGILTGRKEKDSDVAALRREAGLGEYRLNVDALKRFFLSGFDPSEAKPRVGDQAVSYEWFQPAALSLAIGANIADNKGDAKGFAGSVAAAAKNTDYGRLLEALTESVSIVEDQPMLVGLKRLFQKGSIGEGILDAVTAVPATFVPTLVNQVRQAVDPNAREYITTGAGLYGLEGPLRTAANQTMNRIPGLSQNLPKKYGVFGDEKMSYPAGNDPASVFITPWNTDVLNLTPETAMVLGIYDKSGIASQAPRVVDRAQTGWNTDFKLDNSQVSMMQKEAGEATKDVFRQLAKNEKFMSLPDADKAKMLGQVLTEVNGTAKVRPFLEHMGVELPPELPLKNAKELLDGLASDKRWDSATEDQRRAIVQKLFSQVEQKIEQTKNAGQ